MSAKKDKNMKKIVLNRNEQKYFMDVLNYNGMINSNFDDSRMYDFLRVLEERAKTIAINRLPSANTYDGNYYVVPIECRELIKCIAGDSTTFELTFQKTQLYDPKRMKRILVWEFLRHNIFTEE